MSTVVTVWESDLLPLHRRTTIQSMVWLPDYFKVAHSSAALEHADITWLKAASAAPADNSCRRNLGIPKWSNQKCALCFKAMNITCETIVTKWHHRAPSAFDSHRGYSDDVMTVTLPQRRLPHVQQITFSRMRQKEGFNPSSTIAAGLTKLTRPRIWHVSVDAGTKSRASLAPQGCLGASECDLV
jgi:hypothetical protein